MLKPDIQNTKLQRKYLALDGIKKVMESFPKEDTAERNRLALAVFRYVIEDMNQWSPSEALENLSMCLIEKMKLNDEWNNLDLPNDVRDSGLVSYIVEMLYPTQDAQV